MTLSSLIRNLRNPRPCDGTVDIDENDPPNRGAKSMVLISRNCKLPREQFRLTPQ